MNPETISTAAKVVNTAMVILIAYGLTQRRRPKVHIPVMLTAFAVDLVNVLIVELVARAKHQGEGAVEAGLKAMSGSGTFLEQFHIIVSVLCIVGYVVALVTGTRLYRRWVGRTAHRANAGVFVVTRLASYVTSFWM